MTDGGFRRYGAVSGTIEMARFGGHAFGRTMPLYSLSPRSSPQAPSAASAALPPQVVRNVRRFIEARLQHTTRLDRRRQRIAAAATGRAFCEMRVLAGYKQSA